MCKENKNNDFIQQFFSSKSRIPPLSRVPCRMCLRVLRQQHHADALLTGRCTLDNGGIRDLEEKNCWIKSLLLFSLHTKTYSHIFVKLRLNNWCLMDYFTDVLTTFLGLGTFQLHCCLWRVGLHQKYLNLCSEDEQRSYEFGTAWGWVINYIFFIKLSP